MRVELVSDDDRRFWVIELQPEGVLTSKGRPGGKLQGTFKRSKARPEFDFNMALHKALAQGFRLAAPIPFEFGTLVALFAPPLDSAFHVPCLGRCFDYDAAGGRIIVGRDVRRPGGPIHKLEIQRIDPRRAEVLDSVVHDGTGLVSLAWGAELSVLAFTHGTKEGRVSTKLTGIGDGGAKELGLTDCALHYGQMLAFDRTGARLAYLNGRSVVVHDVAANDSIGSLRLDDMGHASTAFSLAPDGQRVALWSRAPSDTSSITIHEVPSGKEIVRIAAPLQAFPTALTFDGSGQTIMMCSACANGGFFAWDATSGAAVLEDVTASGAFTNALSETKYPDYMDLGVVDGQDSVFVVGYGELLRVDLKRGRVHSKSSYLGNFSEPKPFLVRVVGDHMLTRDFLGSLALWELGDTRQPSFGGGVGVSTSEPT